MGELPIVSLELKHSPLNFAQIPTQSPRNNAITSIRIEVSPLRCVEDA